MTQQTTPITAARGETLSMLLRSKRCQDLIQEQKELERQAVPLYKEMLSSIPFYQERMNDGFFWSQFVSSRIVAARQLVERQEALYTVETEKK